MYVFALMTPSSEALLNQYKADLKLSLEYKEMLKKSFDLKKVMKLNLNLSNGATLPIRLSDPEYIGGISYIFLNPEHIDITDYVDINECSSVIAYLEDCHNETLFSFSGIYARNPLTPANLLSYSPGILLMREPLP